MAILRHVNIFLSMVYDPHRAEVMVSERGLHPCEIGRNCSDALVDRVVASISGGKRRERCFSLSKEILK